MFSKRQGIVVSLLNNFYFEEYIIAESLYMSDVCVSSSLNLSSLCWVISWMIAEREDGDVSVTAL